MNPAVEALYLWMETSMRHSMRDMIRFSKERNMSMTQMGALLHLYQGDHCGVSHIGEHLGVSSAAASQMLDRLVQQDFVRRDEDSADRRAKRLSLTEKGLQMIQDGFLIRKHWLSDLVDTLLPEEQKAVVEIINKLVARAETLFPTDESQSH